MVQSLLASIKALAPEEAMPIQPRAYIRRKGRSTWVLVDRDNRIRARWGDAIQIEEDAAYYLLHGHLPPPKGGPW